MVIAAKRIVLGALVALALGACANTGAAPTPDAPAYSAADTLTLSRSRCFGFCPDYTVTINGEGLVSYEGRAFVRMTGRQTRQADLVETARLFSRADEIGFFALRDEYRANISDIPEYRVTYVRAGQSKTVLDYGGGAAGMPESVRALEDEIDRVSGIAAWIERPEGPLTR